VTRQSAVVNESEIRSRLEAVGQEHLLRFADTLSADQRGALLERVAALDIERLPRWIEQYVLSKPTFTPPTNLAPAPYLAMDPATPGHSWDRDKARAEGEALLNAGKVAAFTVAGGQGTRLGFDGPKGMHPAGAVTGKPLFECLADWIIASQDRFDGIVPWCVMTSPINHDATVAFFAEHRYFGLDPADVFLFPQGVMPTFDKQTGKVLLAGKDAPAVNPDGHGGSLRALWTSGTIEQLQKRGIEHLSYVQVDNPLARMIDPVFIGLHAKHPDSSGQMSSKMLEKTDPAEKVGLLCAIDGRVSMVEYSDLPEELARQRDGDRLRFNAGNPAIHMLGVEFIARLNQSDEGFALPYHRAEKKTPYVDLDSGALVEPSEANSVKLESFVFDALALCERSLILETDRIDEFAPIKNASGTDSLESCARIQTERAARWLEAAGVAVPRNADGEPECTLEISPIAAMTAEEFARLDLPESIERGASVVFETM